MSARQNQDGTQRVKFTSNISLSIPHRLPLPWGFHLSLMVNSAFDVDREIECLIALKLLSVPLKLVLCWSPDGQRQRMETNSRIFQFI